MRQSDYLIMGPRTGRQLHVLVCCHFPWQSGSHVTNLLQGSVRWELEVMMALLTHLFSVSYPSIYPPHPNCTHLLVLAPLRPKCDLCPDKGRWKRDCQTGRAGSEPLWGYCPGGADEWHSHMWRKARSQSGQPCCLPPPYPRRLQAPRCNCSLRYAQWTLSDIPKPMPKTVCKNPSSLVNCMQLVWTIIWPQSKKTSAFSLINKLFSFT